MLKIKDKRVKLTKISALKFGDNHPNNINTGYVKEGIAINDLEIGGFLMVAFNYKQFYTSTITSINEKDMIFETENSVYKIEILKNQETNEQN